MDAISRMGATSGDIVILDPHSGEIRAMASRRGDSTVTAAAITEPFEPGSTLKPFIAAGLLERGLVKPSDSVDTGNGNISIAALSPADTITIGGTASPATFGLASALALPTAGTRVSVSEDVAG